MPQARPNAPWHAGQTAPPRMDPSQGGSSTSVSDLHANPTPEANAEGVSLVPDEDDLAFDELHHTAPLRHAKSPTRRHSFELYTPDEDAAVRRKLDLRLVSFVAVLYALSFLDRSNIGNAQLAGLSKDLGLTDRQYTILLRSFYVTYILFEWMTLLYRVFPAHIYVAICVLGWGTIASLQAVTTGFAGMLLCRLALGISEAAFVGIPYYLSFFFKRYELAYRVGIFISAAPLASCFASSLAYAITKWGDKTSIQSWRLLFLIEGFPSILAAFWVWRLLPDSPSEARWLSPRERFVAESRLRGHKPTEHESSTTSRVRRLDWRAITATLRDSKAYLTAGMLFSCNIAFSSMPVFEPTIIKSMGYHTVAAQGLSALPHLVAFFSVHAFSYLSDLHRSRAWFIIAAAITAQLGYLLLAFAPFLHLSPAVKYLCLFPITSGFFTAVTLVIVWTLDNQESATGKGAGMTILQVFGQIGSIIGTGLYSEKQGPDFVTGHSICGMFMGITVALAGTLRRNLVQRNRLLHDAGYEMVTALKDEDEDSADLAATWDKPDTFRYVL